LTARVPGPPKKLTKHSSGEQGCIAVMR
jgi:hypothetical protein